MTGVAGRPTISATRFADRIARAARGTTQGGFDALLVGVGPDLRYLTGYEALPLERLTMLVIPSAAAPRLVAPRLELAAARAGVRPDVAIDTWEETEDPHALVASLVGKAAGRVGASDRLWASHLLRLQAALPGVTFESATAVLRDLRMVKDPDEIELLRLAAHAADRVIARIAAGPLVGRTEADVAREVRERLLAEGHELAEFSIVASGPNSASPHHEASERVIRAGDPIVLDIGGTLGGYGSDITRMVWVTGGDPAKGPDAEYLRLYGVLQNAQDEATGSARAGVACERIDAVARGIIEAAGYGPNFIHRTGHGIGLEGHEEPYLIAGNAEPLREGAAFSVEPGIYLEGRYGARIEDIVVCGSNEPIVLNQAPRDLLIVDG
ncbi:MAG: Xaa-Pro peptidase family protein [Chloroflexota bacterium]